MPPGGLVHAIVNNGWGINYGIAIKKHGEYSFMFHIPHETTGKWVIERVFGTNDCLLCVVHLVPAMSLKSQEFQLCRFGFNSKISR